ENHPNCEDVEVAPDHLTFLWRTDPANVDIHVGSVVVGEKGGGYVRRVTSIATEGNRIAVTTEPASMADAMLEGELSMPLVQEGGWTQCPEGTVCAASDRIDLSNLVLFDGEVEGVPLLVRIPRGELQFSPGVNFDMSIGFPGKIEHLSGSVTGSFVADIDVEALTGGAVVLDHEIDVSGPGVPLQSFPFTFVAPTPLGPLPIVGTVNMDVFVGFRAGASAVTTVSTGVRATAEIDVGATYDDGEWTASAEPSIDVVGDPIEISSQVDTAIEAYARPEVNVVFYGVAGPRFALEPLLRLTNTLAPPEPVQTTLEACLRGELGFSVQILSFSIADFSRSLERCTTLFDSDQV
ncbi:MAG TPA: hypothetical protein VNO33_14510, partial [Kofleriaceae bacterium]|nr:hypothetical protein [Kofleriaceae bacterium]